jgi:hypothetical protein
MLDRSEARRASWIESVTHWIPDSKGMCKAGLAMSNGNGFDDGFSFLINVHSKQQFTQ